MAVRLPDGNALTDDMLSSEPYLFSFHPYLLIFLVEISCPRNKYLAVWQDNHTDKWMQWFRGWHQRSPKWKGLASHMLMLPTGFELFLFVCCRDSYGFHYLPLYLWCFCCSWKWIHFAQVEWNWLRAVLLWI